MKKHFTLLFATVLAATQIKAQLDMAFISHFSLTSGNSIHRLNWTVANNSGANTFEIERGINGKDFKTVALLMATQTFATESYSYSDTLSSQDKIMYRLKIVSKNQNTFYSRIITTQSKTTPEYSIKILGNPIGDKLSLNYTSKNAEQADLKIYNFCGKPVLNQKINIFKGSNFITIPLNSDFSRGMYVIEINSNILSLTVPFIKQ